MKKTAFFMLAIATICCCKKVGKDCCVLKNELVNKWELRKSEGGIAGPLIYPPGLGFILEFKNDAYLYFYKDSVIQAGSYHEEYSTEKQQYSITFHTDTNEWSRNAILKGDTLVLLKAQPCCDMTDDTYVKVK